MRPPMNIKLEAGISRRRIDSPLGPMVAEANSAGICRLEFIDPARPEPGDAQSTTSGEGDQDLVGEGDQHRVGEGGQHLDLLRDELNCYFSGSLRTFSVPLSYQGTPFQQRVWEQLLQIPYGETRSYEDVARALGMPAAVRAVGRANGLNRIAIVIPCHRVVNKNGRLGGYAGGLERKQYLLVLEQSHLTSPAQGVLFGAGD